MGVYKSIVSSTRSAYFVRRQTSRYVTRSTLRRIYSNAWFQYDELSTFPIAALTAWNALYGGKPLIPGQTVLLQGTGGVSMFGLLIAKAAGARTIITSSSDEKLAIAKEMGATHTINYKQTPEWDVEVRRLTNDVGAHHVLDNVGINEIERCFGSVAAGGTITCIGFLGGVQPKATPNVTMLALLRRASLRYDDIVSIWRPQNIQQFFRGITTGSGQQLEELLQFAEFNEIHPRIDRVFTFEEAVEAFQYLESGQHFGKVVIRVASQ